MSKQPIMDDVRTKELQKLQNRLVWALYDYGLLVAWLLNAGDFASAKERLTALMDDIRVMIDDIETAQRTMQRTMQDPRQDRRNEPRGNAEAGKGDHEP